MSDHKCLPCEDPNLRPLRLDIIEQHLNDTPNWILSEEGKSISRKYAFADFAEAMKFVNQAAEIAEDEGHHPDIFVHYNEVVFTLFTHAIGGLSENDFIVAKRINGIETGVIK